jgi:hypothetical protein
MESGPIVVAAAGRRIDIPHASHPAFSLDHVPVVRERVREFLKSRQVTAVVASAACGADLIVLDEAARLNIRLRVILHSPPGRFRADSVTDRPGEWGPLFDRIIDSIGLRRDLIIAINARGAQSAYAGVNRLILENALILGRESGQTAEDLLVWEGRRKTLDLTEDFRRGAERRGMCVWEIRTVA